ISFNQPVDSNKLTIEDNSFTHVTFGGKKFYSIGSRMVANLNDVLANNSFPEGHRVVGDEIRVPTWTDYADISWYDSSQSTFTIDTAEELAGLAELVNNGTTFKNKTVNLDADIDLQDIEWIPIGNSSKYFSGVF